MRIHSRRHCMVVHAYYPIGEPRVKREADALVAHGYQVDVICLRRSDEPYYEVIDSVHIYRLPIQRHKSKGIVVQLIEYSVFFVLATIQLNILHFFKKPYRTIQVHNPPDFLVFSTLIPRLFGARVILDLHDLMPEFFASRFRSGMQHWGVVLLCWQEWLACLFAHRVITVTELWRQTLIRRGVPATKCQVVMNLADPHFFDINATRITTKTNDQFRLIYHGNLTRRYGLDCLLGAINQVCSSIPNIFLTIHGRGEYLSSLKELIQEYGLQNYVHLSNDLVPVTQLPSLILSADVGVVPYHHDVFTDDILPTKLIEYAALGIPAIAARTTAISTYFDDKMVQFFTPGCTDELAACIEKLYYDPEHLKSLSRGIQAFTLRYNWQEHQKNYLDLVDQLL